MNIQFLLKNSLIAIDSFLSLLSSRFFGVSFLSNAKNHQKKILIYLDKGVSLQSAYGTMFYTAMLLREEGYQIKFTNAEYLLGAEPWESNTALLILPGGRSRPYYDSLKATWRNTTDYSSPRKLEKIGEGNERIINFVNSGGSFLGICAGAYYASERTVFEKNSPLEILDEGPLKFFSGTAIGPAYGNGKFSYWNKRGVETAQIKLANNEKIDVYFNGGCFFKQDVKDDSTEIVAKYNDIKEHHPAIVICQIGGGKVLLSGVHFEISYWMVPLYSLLNPDFFKKMYFSNSRNIEFFNDSLRKLLIRKESCEIKNNDRKIIL